MVEKKKEKEKPPLFSSISSDPAWVSEIITKIYSNTPDWQKGILEPNKIINELNFSFDRSYTTGSWGELNRGIEEFHFKKATLLSVLCLIGRNEYVSIFLKSYSSIDSLIATEFAEYNDDIELKDSNLVRKYTFSKVLPIHIASLLGLDISIIKLLKGSEIKCGEFKCHHKSHLYTGEGKTEGIVSCTSQQIIDLDKKVQKSSEY